MSRIKLSRRTVLRGLLGGAAVTVGLPLLDVFKNDHGTALADGTAFPRRFGIFFWGNGVLPARWVPAQTSADVGTEWQLSEQLASLAPVKNKLTVVSGMRVQTGNDMPHGSGPGGMLSGAPVIVRGNSDWTFARETIDQTLAREIGSATRFRSIEAGVEPGVTGESYKGPDSKNPPETSPFALFDRIFGAGFVEPGDEPIIDPRVALRRSVLDAVMDDSRRLSSVVGSADRERLEQHFEGIRDLELRLARLEEDPPNLESCSKPAEPAREYPDIEGRPQMPLRSRAMSDLLAMAMACDQTRITSLWFSEPVGNLLYPDKSAGHHRLTHDEPGDQPQVNDIVKRIVTEYSYYLQALDAIPEGDGTLLDSCCILATTDCAFGRQHTLEDYPIVLGGGLGGYFKTNFHYRSIAAENTSKVSMSILRGMGLSVGEYGIDGGRVTEALTAIEEA